MTEPTETEMSFDFSEGNLDSNFCEKLYQAFLKVQKMQKEEGFAWEGRLDLQKYMEEND